MDQELTGNQGPTGPSFVSDLEAFAEAHVAPGKLIGLQLRRHGRSHDDGRLIFSGKRWLRSAEGERLAAALRNLPAVETARRRGATIALRFTDEAVADLGRRVALGEDPKTADLLASSRYLVGFAGPNTTKALHVGHLRNLALGNALAHTLAAAGAEVSTHSLIGDIGRNVCEAMAGFERSGAGSDPAELSSKSDHFVGRCFRDYLREHPPVEVPSASGDPIARETYRRGDRADELLSAWQRRDPATHAIWRQLRRWVLDGHRTTLDHLGIAVDRADFESDHVTRSVALIEGGIRRGLLARSADGSVSFETGRKEYESMVLLRSDGFPTEHARLLAVYDRVLDACAPGCVYLDLSGDEWQPASAVHVRLMQAFFPAARHARHEPMFHGMLSLDGADVSSSVGDPTLIDDLRDDLLASSRLQALAAEVAPALTAPALAAMILKAHFVFPPQNKRLPFSWQVFLDRRHNRGWDVARALGQALRESGAEPPPPGALPPSYRAAVLQAQSYRGALAHAARHLNLMPLSKFVQHYARLYLDSPDRRALAPVAAATLRRALGSLGLSPSHPRG